AIDRHAGWALSGHRPHAGPLLRRRRPARSLEHAVGRDGHRVLRAAREGSDQLRDRRRRPGTGRPEDHRGHRRRLVAVVRSTLALLLLLGAAQPQIVPRDAPATAPPKPTGTAVIRGRVVAADTGVAIRRALVTVIGGGQGRGRGVQPPIYTDAQGRYETRDLPAGSYIVRARPN